MFNEVQSGFRSKHSPETALLRVSNYIFMHADIGWRIFEYLDSS